MSFAKAPIPWLIALAFTACAAETTIPLPTENWDFMLFVQAWTPQLCTQMNQQHRKCEIAKVGWGIHGLWPNRNDTTYPQFCKPIPPFDESRIAPLENDLDTYWPNSLVDTPHTNFWKHEYEKHGSCARAVPALATEADFFNATLKLRMQYDAGDILTKAGISPSESHTYTLENVRQAFIATVGVEPWVQCSGGYLSQIGLCINKATLKPFQCAKPMYLKAQCKVNNQGIIYAPKGSPISLAKNKTINIVENKELHIQK